MKYIDADRLRTEIERRLDELNPKTGMLGDRPLRAVNPKTFPRESELEKVLYLIDSLQQEQPDKVDFEDVWKTYYDNHLFLRSPMPSKRDIARHFYELGLKARKEE